MADIGVARGVTVAAGSDASPGSIVRRARTEDRAGDAFAAVYRAAVNDVYSYLAVRCGSAALAEDLTQETFMAAMKVVRAGRGHEVTVPWLITAARNKLIDHARRQAREARATAELPVDATVPDELVVWHGPPARDRAMAAIAALPPMHRTVLVLRYLDGLSVPEIAQLCKRTVHATESLLARARAGFKQRYVEVVDE